MEIKGRNKTIIIRESPVTEIGEAVDEYAELRTEMSDGSWSGSVILIMENRLNLVQQFILNYILATRKAFLVWANKEASKQKPKVKQVSSKVKGERK